MICIAWRGFPQYAARCVGALVKATNEKVVVVATHPQVPIEGMERAAGCKVIWISGNNDARDIVTLCGEMPRALLVSGWGTQAFNRYRNQVRAQGGLVIASVDNDFKFSVKEILKAIRFRLLLRRKYDGYLVPGVSARRLMHFYGVSDKCIYDGMYSADENLFMCPPTRLKREKKILFVGQLNSRKNIVPFASAFLKANESGEWTLEVCGCGPDKEKIPQDGSIVVHDFVQPEVLAGIYQTARVFALPSLEEHWGVVVHEAALSGCVLLLSDRVGAAADFSGRQNSVEFDPFSDSSMVNAIRKVMKMSDECLMKASEESCLLARKINKESFVCSVKNCFGL